MKMIVKYKDTDRGRQIETGREERGRGNQRQGERERRDRKRGGTVS